MEDLRLQPDHVPVARLEPCLQLTRLATFVGVDVVEHRLDVGAMFEASFLLALRETSARFVARAALAHETVPDFDLFVGWFASLLETPLQNILVATAQFHSDNKILVLHMEKITAAAIEAGAEVLVVLGRQLAVGVKANLVEHPPEVNDAA